MRLLSLMMLVCLVACGDDDGGADAAAGGADAAASADAPVGAIDAAGPDAFNTICGNPGDPGNEIGVGKFCNGIADCIGNGMAGICATLGDPLAHFCTKTCANEDAGVDVCGTGASCTCGNGGCGCTPNTCL